MALNIRTQKAIGGAKAGRRDPFSELVAAGRRGPAEPKAGGPVRARRSISEQVANRIMAMIKSGNLRTGDQLPTEAQMTIAFGISRPPLREALKALTIMGVVDSRQGGRYSVTDLSPSRLVAPFNVMLSVADYNVNEHFEARDLVEAQLARLCAERASPDMRQRIHKLAVDGRAFHHDPVAFRLLDIEFHEAVYVGAGNQMLCALAQGLYDVGLDVRRIASAMPHVIEKSVRQHLEIAEAVMARDAEEAVAAYRRHLDHVRESTVQSMPLTKPR